jgi:hypothetical protein
VTAAHASPADVFTPLRTYRLAARRIVRDEQLGADRYVALVRLVERAQQDYGRGEWLSVAIQRIVHAEARELLDHRRTPTAPSPSFVGDPVTLKLFALRRDGYSSCPTCRRPIPEPETLAGWEDQARAAWAETLARETAPDRGPA